MSASRLLAVGIVLSILSAGCDFNWRIVRGSGDELRETREVGAFSGVIVRDSIAAEITLDPDQPQSVEISGDDNVVKLVQTRVSAGKLVLDLPPSLAIQPKLPLVVTISATALEHLEASDSATANANRVEGERVLVASSDSSQVAIDTIVAAGDVAISASDSAGVRCRALSGEDLSLTASDSATADLRSIAATGALEVLAQDSSEVVLAGEAAGLEAEISDSSQLDAEDLTVPTVVIAAQDSSVAEVCATKSLDATLSDSSSVSYACDPADVSQKLDDSSTLIEK